MDLSVIIPTFDRPAELEACLAALSVQDMPRERFEVLVVDDGGARSPVEVVAAAESRLPVRLIHAPHRGPAGARNAGAARAAGRYLAFTDDDCCPTPSWLEAMHAALRRHEGAGVGGRTVNGLAFNPYSAASQLLVDFLYEAFNSTPGSAALLTSNNFALSRDVFSAVGGFDPGFPRAAAEDRDLCDRLRAAGVPLYFVPGAVVEHRHRLSFAGFWKQHTAYGAGAFHFHRLRARRTGRRLRVEPAPYYARLVAYPFATRSSRPLSMSGLLLLSQAANALGFAAAAASGRLNPSQG